MVKLINKTKVKLILDEDFELPFELPLFRCIADDGHDTWVYVDTYKGEPIYVGIAERSGGRLDVKGRNSDHRSFILSLPKDDFIERRVAATLSREDAEYLESSLIHFYGRKAMGGSLLNWSAGIEKSPLERLEENGANPWELFELHFWGYTRILARRDFSYYKRELDRQYQEEPTRKLFFQWWVQDTTKKWGTPLLDPLEELKTNERGFGGLRYVSTKFNTPIARKILIESAEAFFRSRGLVIEDGKLIDGWDDDESLTPQLSAVVFEEQDKRSEEILSELSTAILS